MSVLIPAVLRRRTVLAIIFFVSTLAIHLPFALFDAFGEQDAARIAIMAQYGHLSGKLVLANQWPFSTPAYIHLLYLALNGNLIFGDEIIFTMTAFSLLFSSLFTAAFFLFMANATRSELTAAVTTALVQVAPFFWLSSLYGFPTIVALGLFMMATALFQSAIHRQGIGRGVGIGAALLLFVASVLFKVDMVAAAALFCLPVWQQDAHLRVKVAWTAVLCLMAAAAFALLNGYGAMLSADEDAASSWAAWGDSFYDGVSALFSLKNIRVISRAVGAVSFPMALVGGVLAWGKKSNRAIITWTLLTFLPITLFWSMISGNSARHNLIPAVFVTVLMALPLRALKGRARIGWGALLAVDVTVNYLIWAPTAGTIKPSGRLIESASRLKTKMEKRRALAREITALSDAKILIRVSNPRRPFYAFEPLVAPHLRFVNKGGNKIIAVDKETGRKKTFFYVPDRPKRRAKQIAETHGYVVVHAK